MNGHDVGGRQDLAERIAELDRRWWVGHERIVRDNSHPESSRNHRHPPGDAPAADQPDCLAVELDRAVSGVEVRLTGRQPVGGDSDGFGDAQRQRDRVLGSRDGGAVWGIAHGDAPLRRGIYVHLVVSDARASDHEEPGRMVHVPTVERQGTEDCSDSRLEMLVRVGLEGFRDENLDCRSDVLDDLGEEWAFEPDRRLGHWLLIEME